MVKMNKTPEGRHGGHSGEFLDLAGMNILHKIETNMNKNTILQNGRKFLLALCRLKQPQIAPYNLTGEISDF